MKKSKKSNHVKKNQIPYILLVREFIDVFVRRDFTEVEPVKIVTAMAVGCIKSSSHTVRTDVCIRH